MAYPTRAALTTMTITELRQAAFEFATRHGAHPLTEILRARAWASASANPTEEPTRAIELRLLLSEALASLSES